MKQFILTPELHKKIKQFFAENPNGTVKLSWCSTYTKEEYSKWVLSCIHARINRNEPQRAVNFGLYRIQQILNNRGVLRSTDLNEFPERIKKRLYHRVTPF